MRIAFVPAARLLTDTSADGEGLIASTLLRRLAARGHEIIAYCERAELRAPIDGATIHEISAAGASAGLSRLGFARRIARAAAQERFDIAHVLFPFTTGEGYTLTQGVPLVAGPINLPWPMATHRRDRALARLGNTITGRIEERAHARTLQRAARLLVTGPSSRAAIPADLRARCVEVPFGLDLQGFTPQALPEDPTIVFLSVLSERKGVEFLLRAMPAVLARVPRARLIIAGSDPTGMRGHLDALAQDLGIAGRVEFTGPVAPGGVADVFARGRVVCQPSLGEPFGMTVIEAMASGRAIVGTLSGGIADAVVDRTGGRIVPAGDPALLAEALSWVLEHDVAAMGAFNRARAEQHYALDVVVDAIEAVYRTVVSEAAHVAS